jgi:predicted SAM-dependent methyltransferase
MTKLNVGCGSNWLPDFENRDMDLDLRKPLPHASNSLEFILAEHVLEHLTGPEMFSFLEEAHRCLKSGGTLRVCVPELANVDDSKRKDLIINHGHLQVLCEESVRLMLSTAGFKPSLINRTGRKEVDGHFRVIGEPLDTAETLRMEAIK